MRKPVLCCAILVSFASLLSGCLSVANSPSPRFYMPMAIDNGRISEKFDISPGVTVAIGPIGIPEYQDRPQIVTVDREGMLKFAQFDRWGESLDSAIGRLLNDNLTVMLPKASFYIYPCNFAIPLTYQIVVDVVQLESRLDKEMLFVAQWSIIDHKNRQMLFTKRSEFRQPVKPHNYSGLSAALSASCASLSSEIAATLAELSKQPKAEKNVSGGA